MATPFPTLAAIVAMTLAAPMSFAAADGAPRDEQQAGEIQTDLPRTVKERLSGKASDEQRVNNCKVPVDRRGPKPRPDNCR